MQKALITGLRRYPVFNVRDIANTLDKRMNYAYLIAYRLKKAAVIRKIEKGRMLPSDKKELEEHLAKSKEKLKFNLSTEAMQILRNEFGEFSVGF